MLKSRQPGDPFGERSARAFRRKYILLGGPITFECDSSVLAQLVDKTYAHLPAHRFGPAHRPGTGAASLDICLRRSADAAIKFGRTPPPMHMHGGAGFLTGAMTANDFAAIHPQARSALVTMSRQLLRYPYHARYELLEFAVFTLACRARGLTPLHAGCIGYRDRAALLLGDSGAGKSTLALASVLDGLDFVTEDAAFIDGPSGRVSGIGNFLHVRPEATQFVDDASLRRYIRASPVIRRRSGVRKYEVDLRDPAFRLARKPPKLAAIVILSTTRARRALVEPISAAKVLEAFRVTQPYGIQLPGWAKVWKRIERLPAYALHRGAHPADSVVALREILS
jgi:hypothetical protein